MTDVEQRLDALEDDIKQIIEERETYRKKVLKPKLNDLHTASDDAQLERAEQQATLEAQAQRIEELEAQLDALVGLPDDKTGGPTKRAIDVRQGLIREARDLAGDKTVATMHWKEVQRFLSRVGHGSVSKPDCYKAMDWAAGEDGDLPDSPAFWLENGKRRLSGRDVKAVCVDVSNLPSTQGVAPSRNPTTENIGGGEANADD